MCWTEIEAVAVGVLGEGRLTLAGLRECFALRIRRILGKECTLAEETGPANAEKHESKWSTRSAGGSWSGGLWHWLILGVQHSPSRSASRENALSVGPCPSQASIHLSLHVLCLEPRLAPGPVAIKALGCPVTTAQPGV